MAKIAEGIGVELLPATLSTSSSDVDVLRVLAARAAVPFEQIQRERYVASAPEFGWVLDRVLPKGRWRLVPAEFVGQLAKWRQLVPPPGLLATSRRQPRRLNSQHPRTAGASADDSVSVVHPETAQRHGLADGDPIVVSSDVGTMHTAVVCSTDVHPDSVSLPHGWRDANVSLLTSEHHVDELTAMVVQTAIPVTIRRAT